MWKEAFAVISSVVVVGVAIAGLMFSFQGQTNSRIEQLDSRITDRIEQLDSRIYDMNAYLMLIGSPSAE